MGMFDVLGGGNRRGGGMSPIALAVLGTVAYKALKSKGGLGGLFGSAQGAGSAAGADARGSLGQAGAASAEGIDPSAMSGAAAGGLGGLLGGLGKGGLGSGLRDLLDQFRQTGHEEQAQSWVSSGANRPIDANEMEQVLGSERIEWLMQQTGLPKDQLLAGLSKELPDAIDKMTPKGQVPTDDELDNEMRH